MPSERIQEKEKPTTPFHVLVVGGSYAGLAATVNLLDLCHGKPCRFGARYGNGNGNDGDAVMTATTVPVRITIVDERDGFYHLIGSPLAFASSKYASDAWTRFEDIPALQTPEVQFVHGSAVQINCQSKEATVRENQTQTHYQIPYDYLIAASGLRRTWPTVPQALRRKDYLLELASHINATERAEDGVVVVGGGAVGIEMAAELKTIQPNRKVTLIHSRHKLLSSEPLPDDLKDSAHSLLHKAGVETIMNTRVTNITEIQTNQTKSSSSLPSFALSLSDGGEITSSMVINAISKFTPTSSYLPATVLDGEGYVKIEPTLEFTNVVPNASYHYAIGDIASWPGIKRCGAAMHHGHYTAMNLHQKMLAKLNNNGNCSCSSSNSSTEKPKSFELARDVPPGIGLAVGRNAVSYSPVTGVQSGEDVAKLFFEDDLGFKICWNYMRLGNAASG